MSTNKIDLTGHKYGSWTVLEEAPERHNGKVMWRSQCVCGRIKDVAGSSLRTGNSQSCGCKGRYVPVRDMIGLRFGRLVVSEMLEERMYGKTAFLCLCDCGNTTKIVGTSLNNGNTKSCGCLLRSQLKGQRFERLTVIEELTERSAAGGVQWKCLCDCGNYIITSSWHLNSNSIKSCGCLADEVRDNMKEDLTGQRFGRLTVIKEADKRKSGRVTWTCLCDCEEKKDIIAFNLKSGATKSCGCLQRERVSKSTSKNNK